jgi:hypothetical protein
VCNPEAAAKETWHWMRTLLFCSNIEKYKLQIFHCLGRNNDVPAREFESL